MVLVDHNACLRLDAHPEAEGNGSVQDLALRAAWNQTSAKFAIAHSNRFYIRTV